MTREDKLWSMTSKTLIQVAENLGLKIKESELKKGKEGVIKKILEAEAAEAATTTPELVPMPGADLDPEEGRERGRRQSCRARRAEAEPAAEVVAEPGEVKTAEPETQEPEAQALVPKKGAKIVFNGKSQNICTWAKELGISANTLYGRIYKYGWSVEKAFTTPAKAK